MKTETAVVPHRSNTGPQEILESFLTATLSLDFRGDRSFQIRESLSREGIDSAIRRVVADFCQGFPMEAQLFARTDDGGAPLVHAKLEAFILDGELISESYEVSCTEFPERGQNWKLVTGQPAYMVTKLRDRFLLGLKRLEVDIS